MKWLDLMGSSIHNCFMETHGSVQGVAKYTICPEHKIELKIVFHPQTNGKLERTI